uniref:DOMON domain-containing protein n=1 Tax=Panagrellus redivivus TaxID=6233 RepID=A0A7E4ZS42_PANRE
MFFGTLLVCLLAVLGQVSTELVLEKDIAETVTFDGNELVIEVDNSAGIIGDFTLCVKSTDQVSYVNCPTGYDGIGFWFGRVSDVQSFKMDRQGNVMLGTARITMLKTIAFNADEAFEVIRCVRHGEGHPEEDERGGRRSCRSAHRTSEKGAGGIRVRAAIWPPATEPSLEIHR